MKKISLYISLIASAFVMSSCTEDYNADVAAPQSWEQEEIADVPALVLTPSTDINLGEISEQSVQFVTYTANNLPEGATIGDVALEVAAKDSETKYALESTEGVVTTADLQAAVESCYSNEVVAREMVVTATTSINFDGQSLYTVSDAVMVNVTPMPLIIPDYYIVGGVQGWTPTNKKLAFIPTDVDAQTYSITTNFSIYPDGSQSTPNFKIFDGANPGTWDSGVYGSSTDGSTALSGNIVSSGAGAIQTPSNGIYTLTINMKSNKYSMKLYSNEPTTYNAIGLIGAFNGWGADAALKEVAPHYWIYEGFMQKEAGELKFRANNAWDISWGNGANLGEANYGALDLNGANMTLPVGRYNVYFNDITGEAYFVAAE